jgi:hypothetical protein
MRPTSATAEIGTRSDDLNACSDSSVCKSFNDSLYAGCLDSVKCIPSSGLSLINIPDCGDACSNSSGCKLFNNTVYDVVVRFTNLTDLQKHGLDVIVSDSAISSLSRPSKMQMADVPIRQQLMTWMCFDGSFFDGVVIVVNGPYDVGKSFVLASVAKTCRGVWGSALKASPYLRLYSIVFTGRSMLKRSCAHGDRDKHQQYRSWGP